MKKICLLGCFLSVYLINLVVADDSGIPILTMRGDFVLFRSSLPVATPEAVLRAIGDMEQLRGSQQCEVFLRDSAAVLGGGEVGGVVPFWGYSLRVVEDGARFREEFDSSVRVMNRISVFDGEFGIELRDSDRVTEAVLTETAPPMHRVSSHFLGFQPSLPPVTEDEGEATLPQGFGVHSFLDPETGDHVQFFKHPVADRFVGRWLRNDETGRHLIDWVVLGSDSLESELPLARVRCRWSSGTPPLIDFTIIRLVEFNVPVTDQDFRVALPQGGAIRSLALNNEMDYFNVAMGSQDCAEELRRYRNGQPLSAEDTQPSTGVLGSVFVVVNGAVLLMIVGFLVIYNRRKA